MQPNSKFRHIRLLIEKGAFSEALTELLILMRHLKAEGYEVDDLLEKRKILVLKSEEADFGERIGKLLQQLFERFKKGKDQDYPAPIPEPIKKGGSILSKILDRIGLKNRSPKRSPAKERPGPPLDASVGSTEYEKNLPADDEFYQKSHAEDPVEEEEQLPPPSPPLIEQQPANTQPASLKETEDIVNISVYSPETVQKGSRFLLTAFAHLYEQAAEVAERIKQADPTASLQGAKTLNLPVKRKDVLEFRLCIEDWKIEDSVQVLTWFGIPSSVEFEVAVPEDFEKKQIIGSLLIKGGSGSLGRVRFNFSVEKEQATDSAFAPTDSQNIQQAFFAYAEENSSQVEKHRVEMKAQGLKIIDPWKMEGEDWEIKVSDGLVESELYCLFWSKEAYDSDEVEISWQMALGHRLSHPKRLPDMLPVLLGEPIPEAPSELAFLNFIHKKTSFPALQEDLAQNAPAAFKSKAEEYLMDGKEEAFELLYTWFQEDEDMLDEILMQHTRWNTLKKKVRIRLLSAAEAKTEEHKIIHACLGIIGRV